MPAGRQLLVLREEETATRHQARVVTAHVDPDEVLWVGPGEGEESRPERLLGRAFDAVVVSLHDRLDLDRIGLCQGFVRGGGALVLRVPPDHALPRDPRLVVWPHALDDVGLRAWERVLGRLPDTPLRLLKPADHGTGPTPDQDAVVRAGLAVLDDPAPHLVSLTARRGRGKSAALGRMLRQVLEDGTDRRIVVTASDPDATCELFRFATGDPTVLRGGRLRFVPLRELLLDPPAFDVLAVEEAARIPVPTLQRLVGAHPDATVLFATTTQGYEGTGRGFVLRFLAWASARSRPLVELQLTAPIRWAPDCPLEAAVDGLLALDATPGPLPPAPPAARPAISAERLDRDALARDESLLREVFGLLVQAHYRTTPGDLAMLLDAPNVEVFALREGSRVLAASLVAREGGFPPDMAARLARGQERVRGHALADSLIVHGGRESAGPLRMIRSIRIATRPELRRQGLARALVHAVHHHHPDADLFGTVFGATPGLLRFRQQLGYALVRVGGSRGERTGEPAAVMVRPVSQAAHDVVRGLRAELHRGLDAQLRLLAAEGELGLEPALTAALHDALPASADGAWHWRFVLEGYLDGPRIYDSVAWAARILVMQAGCDRTALTASEQALVQARVVDERSWRDTAAAAGLPSVRATQRALRRALQTLFDTVEWD
ncbi:MAG: tRNA(Met) cytidine acetyltransferase [Alphaproteobacteria bacterium]|nr:tRNA(Met) cytidine acetyltransferase [Alphaproteobacteria bacterium]